MDARAALEKGSSDGEPFGFRECPTCPEWVVRCAHFEGQAAWIRDVHMFPHGLLRGDHYAVAGPGPYEEGGCCNPPHPVLAHGARGRMHTDDLPSAEAEFYRREEELLERTPA